MIQIQTVKDLVPHDKNPRTITDESLKRLNKTMEVLGDLSPIIFNRKTRKQVTGHQRCKILGNESATKIECKYFDEVDHQGTIGIGFILIMREGRKDVRWGYREVIWDEATEAAAMICANTNAGEWSESLLREELILAAEGGIDQDLTGLDGDFTEQLFRKQEQEVSVQQLEEQGLTDPLTAKQVALLPSQTAMLQLYLTIESRPKLIKLIEDIRALKGYKTVTETVQNVIESYHQQYIK